MKSKETLAGLGLMGPTPGRHEMDRLDLYNRIKKNEAKAVSKVNSKASGEFGEAMGKDFWVASKMFWQTVWYFRRWGDKTMLKLCRERSEYESSETCFHIHNVKSKAFNVDVELKGVPHISIPVLFSWTGY